MSRHDPASRLHERHQVGVSAHDGYSSVDTGKYNPCLVSVAIPLYASKRFVSLIAENIEALDVLSVEVIVSDRHCLDDSLQVLRHRFSDDSRVRFIERTDGIGWVAHYNELLRIASGKYFIWMPHDDSFPLHYVRDLVAELEEDGNLALAFGSIEPMGLDGAPLRPGRLANLMPFRGHESRTVWDAVRLLFWGGGIPFRGVFRRDIVIERQWFVPATLDSAAADACWVFGLSLIGSLRFVDSCRCVKRYHPLSTSDAMCRGMRVRHLIDVYRTLRSCIRDSVKGRLQRLQATAGVLLWSAFKVLTLRRARRRPTYSKRPR